jgi:hypothetical protein
MGLSFAVKAEQPAEINFYKRPDVREETPKGGAAIGQRALPHTYRHAKAPDDAGALGTVRAARNEDFSLPSASPFLNSLADEY